MLIASLGLPWGTYPEWSSCGTSQISDWGATSIHSLHQLPADLRRSSQFTHDERRCQAAVLSGDRLLVKQQQILHASSSNPRPFCTSNHQQKRHKKTQVSGKKNAAIQISLPKQMNSLRMLASFGSLLPRSLSYAYLGDTLEICCSCLGNSTNFRLELWRPGTSL